MSLRRNLGLLAACLAVLGAGAAWFAASHRLESIAIILTVCIAALALGTLIDIRRPTTSITPAMLDEAAWRLARVVSAHESSERRQLVADPEVALADTVVATPDPVWLPIVTQTERGNVTTSQLGIAELFMQLTAARLVILGAGGGGKTALANHLVLDLIERTDQAPASLRVPVPVRLSLPAFDPGADHEDIALVAARLEAWIAEHLNAVYLVSRRVARALVDQGRIMAVLDGLDEMDPETDPPTRAVAVIQALNHRRGGTLRGCIVSCRTDRYRALEAGGTTSEPNVRQLLEHAAVVEIQPHTPSVVAEYLTRRFPDGHNGHEPEPRWQPVLKCLHDQPDGPLAKALGSPLRLFLVVAAYYLPDSQPAELLHLPPDAVDRQLFRNYIPAVTREHVLGDGSRYRPADVARWMGTLASHLAAQSRHGGSGTDLDLSSLWTATGSSVPRYVGATFHSLLVAVALGAGAGLYIHFHAISADVTDGVAYAVGSAAVVAYTFRRANRPSVQLSKLDMSPLGTASGRRRLLNRLAPGLVAGLVGGLAVGPTAGLALGLAITVVGGITDAFANLVTRRPTGIGRPSQLVTQGVTHDVVVLITYGFVGALVGAVAGGFPFKPSAASIGLSFGLVAGAVNIAASPWVRYFTATFLLVRRNRLPTRPARLLDWAYNAGLLRLAGIFIQFRHREFQEQLADSWWASVS